MGLSTLLAVERATLAGAAGHRAREVSAGRVLARRCLERLRLEPVPIPMGHDRAPIWPPEVVGSISHWGHAESGILARLIFTAKEAAYKAQYPLTRTVPDFDAVRVELHLPPGHWKGLFRAVLLRAVTCLSPRT